ncbi:MAG: hypothetical protein HY075_12355 [Deltaproteobacteria bacterium]|nr:hypothetical protein [Deltaproteobacteria bacterium]
MPRVFLLVIALALLGGAAQATAQEKQLLNKNGPPDDGDRRRALNRAINPNERLFPMEYDDAIKGGEVLIQHLEAEKKPHRDFIQQIDDHHFPEVHVSKLENILDKFCNNTTKFPLTRCKKGECAVERSPSSDLCERIFESPCYKAMATSVGLAKAGSETIIECPMVKRKLQEQAIDDIDGEIFAVKEKQQKAAELRDKAVRRSLGLDEEKRDPKSLEADDDNAPLRKRHESKKLISRSVDRNGWRLS